MESGWIPCPLKSTVARFTEASGIGEDEMCGVCGVPEGTGSCVATNRRYRQTRSKHTLKTSYASQGQVEAV